MVSNVLLLLMLFSLFAVLIYSFSMFIRLFKREDWKEEGVRVLIFFALSVLFFVFFGFSI